MSILTRGAAPHCNLKSSPIGFPLSDMTDSNLIK